MARTTTAWITALSLAWIVAGCDGATLRLDDARGDDGAGDDDADDDDADDDTGDDDTVDDDTGDDDTDPPNQAPVAAIDGPLHGWCDEELSFDGAASADPDGEPIAGFAWSTSDGQSGDQSTFRPVFTDPGSYQIALRVWDEGGLEDETAVDVEIAVHGDQLWTMLVFVNADNNLEEAGLADLDEMELIGSTANVNVVVQIDRHVAYTAADGDWTGARRYYVTHDAVAGQVGSLLIDDLGEVDMGDPATAVEFVTWGIDAYPADRYAVVFWNHGDGWSRGADDGEPPQQPLKGFSSDDHSGHEISVAQGDLEWLLAEITDHLGRPIDLLGFDACLMQMWEVGAVSAPYAEVLVASEDSEGFDGWEYTGALGDLVAEPTMDAATLGDAIAARYVAQGSQWDYPTQSVVDLGRYDELAGALDQLAIAVLDGGAAARGDVLDAADATTAYSWMPHRDLREFAERLASTADADVAAAADAVVDAVDDAVISAYNAAGASSTGIAIYLPGDSWWESYDTAYHTGAGAVWAQQTAWDEMLQAL